MYTEWNRKIIESTHFNQVRYEFFSSQFAMNKTLETCTWIYSSCTWIYSSYDEVYTHIRWRRSLPKRCCISNNLFLPHHLTILLPSYSNHLSLTTSALLVISLEFLIHTALTWRSCQSLLLSTTIITCYRALSLISLAIAVRNASHYGTVDSVQDVHPFFALAYHVSFYSWLSS